MFLKKNKNYWLFYYQWIPLLTFLLYILLYMILLKFFVLFLKEKWIIPYIFLFNFFLLDKHIMDIFMLLDILGHNLVACKTFHYVISV